MNDISVERLISFACPILVNQAGPLGKNYESLYSPPFPCIDLNSEGFTIPHLHWVGVNVSKPWLRKQLIKLARLHEWCHESLIRTPFSLVTTWRVVELYELILKICREGGETIDVPLRRDTSRNELEEIWALVVRLKRASRHIEEVYAVRTSLLKAKNLGYIEDELAQEILTHYKIQYEKLMPGFQLIYEAFDLVAGDIGDTATTALVHSALGTFQPGRAFLDTIFFDLDLGRISKKRRKYISNLSFEQAYHYFTEAREKPGAGSFAYRIKDELSQDDSLYNREDIAIITAKIEQDWGDLTLDGKGGFYNFFLDTLPNIRLNSQYNHSKHVVNFEDFQEVKHGRTYLFSEAILQQLTTGKGLLCPYWLEFSPNCCHETTKAFLERIWSCTSHNRSCNWKRMGCLAQGCRAKCL